MWPWGGLSPLPATAAGKFVDRLPRGRCQLLTWTGMSSQRPRTLTSSTGGSLRTTYNTPSMHTQPLGDLLKNAVEHSSSALLVLLPSHRCRLRLRPRLPHHTQPAIGDAKLESSLSGHNHPNPRGSSCRRATPLEYLPFFHFTDHQGPTHPLFVCVLQPWVFFSGISNREPSSRWTIALWPKTLPALSPF